MAKRKGAKNVQQVAATRTSSKADSVVTPRTSTPNPAVQVGDRIREARESKSLTQQDIAKVLGISRSAVAQWESGTTSPSIHTVSEVAKLLDRKPQWLAYGVSQEPQIIHMPPPGAVSLPEVAFGEKHTDVQELRNWTVPSDYLKGELNCLSSDGLVIWRIESPNMAPLYEYGDKVIVDTNAKRPSPSGVFLLWDGVGPTLNNVSVVPVAGKSVARVTSTDGTSGYEVPADKLVVIGRVRGLLKNI